jgi:Flp pilus assembly protein TadG
MTSMRRFLAWIRDDRGSSAVELAILAPTLIVVSLLIVQFALWFDAKHAALAAAQEGDRAAREEAFVNPSGWQSIAVENAMNYYQALDTSVLSQVNAQATYTKGNNVSVTVSGQLNGIWTLTVSETVTGPVECFRTSQSQGASCG